MNKQSTIQTNQSDHLCNNVSNIFYKYGKFCASRPMELMIGFLALSICLFSYTSLQTTSENLDNEKNQDTCNKDQINCINEDDPIDDGFVIIARCLAIFYIFHSIKNLFKLSSKYLTHISILFTLKSKSKDDISENIAQGIMILGPKLTLETFLNLLFIGIGFISKKVGKMEELMYYTFLSVIVNYIIFMIFLPACLSLSLELSCNSDKPSKLHYLSKVLKPDTERIKNPVIQRVELIMSAGLMLIHIISRFPNFDIKNSLIANSTISPLEQLNIMKSSTIENSKKQQDNGFNDDYSLFLLFGLAILVIHYIYEEIKAHQISTSNLKKENTQLEENKINNKQPLFFIDADENSSDSLDSLDNNKLIDKECKLNLADDVKELNNINDKKMCELDQFISLLNSEDGLKQLTDEEILVLVEKRKIPAYKLESILGDPERGVKIRRMFLSKEIKNDAISKIPYEGYDYSSVMSACCENVIGYMPIPLGTAGPLLLDGLKYQVPLATTEGCLVASINRGCRALFLAGGVESSIYGDKMTRAPVVRFPTARKAVEALNWIEIPNNFQKIKEAFDSTSRFAKLINIQSQIMGNRLYMRFAAETGDAMGMNMISKGCEESLKKMQEIFPEMEIISLSGNFCTDKKPSSVNWINGRGKSVVCEAVVPAKVVKEILKTSTKNLVSLNISKNLIGSAAAGSIGGFNAHAANIVAAIYIAAGQDPAQVVGSSNCMTLLEESYDNPEDLLISCTMPSIELGTIGGGTILGPQSSCLEILGIRGSENLGENSRKLARIVCATVLAGELSLLSSLAAGTLVKSHMKYNRSNISINASSASLINNNTKESICGSNNRSS